VSVSLFLTRLLFTFSADEFHAKALRAYIARFDFRHDPLDVALRRLLMDVGLPRETQQIDRVMEAFADHYRQCHPTLFFSEGSEFTVLFYDTPAHHYLSDHPYILAFSLIMLHTDAFNKSNKRKMTKADYVKNTSLPGVPPEVLDVREIPLLHLRLLITRYPSAFTTTLSLRLSFSLKIPWI
jgi:hypothetical protein